MKAICNLHTHTTFCDGKSTPEENVLAAINGGLTTLGFSAHSPYCISCDYVDEIMPKDSVDAYRNEVLRLREKYADRIEILLGIEQDGLSPRLELQYDYVIGSVHYVEKDGVYIPIDNSPEMLKRGIDEQFSSDATAFCREYYKTVADIVAVTDCDIIGHFDVVTKFNEKHPFVDEDDRAYRSAALEALDALLESGRIFEVNTGAMSRGWRKRPYPAPFIIERIVEKKGRLMLTSDAHNAQYLTYGFAETAEYLKAFGMHELWVWKNGGFLAVSV